MSTLLILITCGIVVFIGFLIIVFYGSKQSVKMNKLHQEDGLYDESYYYRKAMLWWTPIAVALLIMFSLFLPKWQAALKNLNILFNVVILIAPARIIQIFMVRKNRDKIRPKQPFATGARIITGVLYAFMIVYVIYQSYVFITGKPGL
jgi:hypothetical protein